jgi:hypothetical protein
MYSLLSFANRRNPNNGRRDTLNSQPLSFNRPLHRHAAISTYHLGVGVFDLMISTGQENTGGSGARVDRHER